MRMAEKQPWQRAGRGWVRVIWLALFAFAVGLQGCEVDSFLDPSTLGRWERTPVVLPILDQLDVIDEPESSVLGYSDVQPADLIPVVHEYVIGPGDIVTVTVFELIAPNVESIQTRRVNALGVIRLPIIGTLNIEGLTPTQLEDLIVDILDRKGVLKEATVSVVIQDSRQNTYSVIGEPRLSGTAIGTYTIPKSDFRLLDAMALARGVSGSIKNLHVIRQVPLAETPREVIRSGPVRDRGQDDHANEAAPRDPGALIEDLLDGAIDEQPGDQMSNPDVDPAQRHRGQGQQPPAALGRSLDSSQDGETHWVNVDGKWVRVERAMPSEEQAPDVMVTQRIIEVPYDKLLEGDMRYNIVIRAGDVVRVPPPVIGNVYIGGAISRPGTYALPGDKDLTLKQLVFAAGNVSPLAIPERVDLIRRVGNNQEAIVRLNLRAIFSGEQPDFYLKPNDTINIGTNFAATPLAVVRNGFRTSYGFGFIFDRNFGVDVFGSTNNN